MKPWPSRENLRKFAPAVAASTRTSNLPANFSDDPYLDYGIEAATAGANFLKFSRDGQGFTYGMDSTPLPLGTKLAANMAGVRVGWLKWLDGKPELPRADLAPEQKGPSVLERRIVTVNVGNVFRRLQRWLRE